MSTATFTPAARRFAWKEYRMLRGLWLAVAALAVAEQAISCLLAEHGMDLPAWLFGSALAASALYAVGAAAILFAVEHEDETYGFLSGLPTTWLPIFIGKLFVAAFSSIALAIALLLTGWSIAGSHWPSPSTAGQLTALFALAILEALAWGTLFSLLLRQPLLAALLAIFAASASVTLLINSFVGSTNSTLYLSSYVAVVPARTVVFLVLSVVDVLIARNWLPIVIGPASSPGAAPINCAANVGGRLARSTPIARADRSESAGYSRFNIIARLLWQSSRQSWPTMSIMLGIVAFGLWVALLIVGITDPHRSSRSWLPLFPFGVALVGTTLFTSTAFYADQRRDQYRFLAEHAARPRYVWLCRLLTYALPVALLVSISLAVLAIYSSVWIRHFGGQTSWDIYHGRWYGLSQFSRDWGEMTATASGTVLALWGVVIGFTIGQICSLLVRRALLAGFVAVLCSAIIFGWGATVWAWELPRAVFLLPVAIAPLAATWLRAADWIIDRNHMVSWTKVAAAVVLPAVLVAAFVPIARSVTADRTLVKRLIESSVPFYNPKLQTATDSVVADTVAKWDENADATPSPESRANADWLLRLSELVTDFPAVRRQSPANEPSEEEQSKQREKFVELNRVLIDQTVDLSRKECRFPIWQTIPRGSTSRDIPYENMINLIELLQMAGIGQTAESNLDRALEYYLAALRLSNDVQRGQPTQYFGRPWEAEEASFLLVQWAAANGQTSARILGAIRQLEEIYPDNAYATTASPMLTGAGRPHPAMIADYLLLRDVITGRRLPTSFDTNPPYLAYLANRLPFERDRALSVLDYLLVDQTDRWLIVRRGLNQQWLQRHQPNAESDTPEKSAPEMAAELRRQIELSFRHSYFGDDFPMFDDEPPYSWLRTTYLLRAEIGGLEPFYRFLLRCADAEVGRWGLKQQLASIAYRLDHGHYPETLDALAPDYLPFVPLDPYSGRQFEYRPAGLDREFQISYHIEPAATPVLWSVGPQNASLEVVSVDDTNPNAKANPIRPVEHHEVYRLSNSNGAPSMGSQQIFPLPK